MLLGLMSVPILNISPELVTSEGAPQCKYVYGSANFMRFKSQSHIHEIGKNTVGLIHNLYIAYINPV